MQQDGDTQLARAAMPSTIDSWLGQARGEELQQHAAVLTGINRILTETLGAASEDELGRLCLEVAQEVTGSRFAFIGEIDQTGELSDIAIADAAQLVCRRAAAAQCAPEGGVQPAAIYRRVLKEGRSLFTNDPTSHLDCSCSRAQHRAIRALLAVPLFHEGRIRGMVAVGNRAGGYREKDLDALEALAPAISEALHRKRAEQEIAQRAEEIAHQAKLIEQANNAKSRFLAAASHDLRQPIAALTVYADVLKKQLDPRHCELVGHMQDCIGNLDELVSSLLDISKLDSGGLTPKPSDFPIDRMLDRLLAVHRPEATRKGLRLRGVASKLVARTDAVLFQRMLGNLLANAIRYTQRGGVLIGCRRRQGKVWIEVWDTGIGIPAGKTVEIFEDFKQLDEGARASGSGLGLSIVARTAAFLGIEVRVASREGLGSMFAVEMPLASV